MSAVLLALLLGVTSISPRGAAATPHPAASAVAAETLRAGGNAVDAAVAAAFALSVLRNESSGIGGGGYALVWLAGPQRLVALDFREVAPAAATRDMFLEDGRPDRQRSTQGGLAVAVPGAVKGYAELVRRFGKLGLARLVEPAARLAEGGFPVGRHYREAADERLSCLAQDPASTAEFLRRGRDGVPTPLTPGDRLERRDLARTLRLLGRNPEAFYRGPLAEKIAAAVRSRGGLLTAADLAAYRTVERTPLVGTFRGHHVVSIPPPSAGGAIVIALLQALEQDESSRAAFRPVAFLHAFAEVEKRLYAERAIAFADPAFLPTADEAAARFVDPAWGRTLRSQVGPRATPSSSLGPAGPEPAGGTHTAHLSIIDAEGNAVALTTTVNGYFGACLVVPGTGILLNDQMDDFDAAPGAPNDFGLVGSGVNGVEPGKRPLSSMAPTLVFDPSGRVVLAVGSPGGSTIPSTVAQVILDFIGAGQPLDQAVGTPRIHHQWRPDVIQVEPFGLDAASVDGLRALGHQVRFRARPFGDPQAAAVDWRTGLREAASEPRLEGAPAAP